MCQCTKCKKEYLYKRHYGSSSIHCCSCLSALRRTKNKKRIVEYKGGKCEICGYDKCIDVLSFHHKNPSEKDFNVSSANKSFEKIKLEANKCLLLCMNCHMELHEKDEGTDKIIIKLRCGELDKFCHDKKHINESAQNIDNFAQTQTNGAPRSS